MTAAVSLREERRVLAADLRERHKTWAEIAQVFAGRYGVNMRVAFRMAHDWSQRQAADEWSKRWPSDPKSFKNFSYWEQWPAATGHAPSLEVLARLAELYQCSVADLLLDGPDFRLHDSAQRVRSELALLDRELLGVGRAGVSRLVEQFVVMNVDELATRIRSWIAQLDPAVDRRDVLLRISAALALAAADSTIPVRDGSADDSTVFPSPGGHDLSGVWLSRYHYRSSGGDGELHDEHHLVLRQQGPRLTGHSLPQPDGSKVRMSMSVDGSIVTGVWTEHTSPSGCYHGATYHGTIQLVVNPTGRVMTGRWLGFGKDFTVNTGIWNLTWIESATSGRTLRAHAKA